MCVGCRQSSVILVDYFVWMQELLDGHQKVWKLLFGKSTCRIYFLLSLQVFCIWTVLVGASSPSGSGMVLLQLKGGQVSADRKASTIDLFTWDNGAHCQIPESTVRSPAKAWSMCRYIWGGSRYLRTTFHLHFLMFLHSICAAETLNHWYLLNCKMFSIWIKISVHKWLNIKRSRYILYGARPWGCRI